MNKMDYLILIEKYFQNLNERDKILTEECEEKILQISEAEKLHRDLNRENEKEIAITKQLEGLIGEKQEIYNFPNTQLTDAKNNLQDLNKAHESQLQNYEEKILEKSKKFSYLENEPGKLKEKFERVVQELSLMLKEQIELQEAMVAHQLTDDMVANSANNITHDLELLTVQFNECIILAKPMLSL